jgi:hypothetical protein
MSKLRSVNTQFWSDPYIEELTPSEKLLYLYFITNEKTNMLGVYELSIKKIGFETGLNKDVIEKALKGFESVGKMRYTQNHVVLLNFAKHQNYNTNMKKSAIDTYNALPKELKINDELIDRENPSEGFERVLKALGMVRKIEIEDEIEDEQEEEKKFNFRSALVSLGVSNNLVKDWLQVRKTKKAANTETAFNALKKEIQKSGLSAEKCLLLAVENSWAGFKAEYAKNQTNNQHRKAHQSESQNYTFNI